MRKKPIGWGNLKVVADLTRQKRHRNTLDWVERWHKDEEAELVWVLRTLLIKGEQKNTAGTETVCMVI